MQHVISTLARTGVAAAVLAAAFGGLAPNASAAEQIKLQKPQPGCREASHFVDVSTYSHNGRYANPELSVSCTDDEIQIRGNGIINYEYVQITPTDMVARRYNWRIPRKPRVAREKRQVPLLGPIGVAINGIPFFSGNESPQHNWGDPYPLGILDYCGGHTARGMYHYHTRPNCLLLDKNGSVGQVVGYAFDGYPIVSPWICVNESCRVKTKMRSSYKYVGTEINQNAWEANIYEAGYGDLDRCNGLQLPGGGYAYFATERFPYTLACYHGEAQFAGNRRGGGAVAGGPGGKRGFKGGKGKRKGKGKGGPRRSPEQVKAEFERDDVNKDGKLSAAEFGGPYWRFQRADSDGDGFVALSDMRGPPRGGRRGPPESARQLGGRLQTPPDGPAGLRMLSKSLREAAGN